MDCKNLKVRAARDITNNAGQTIYKNDLIEITEIYSNDVTLKCTIKKDDIIIFAKLKDIIY